MVRAIFWFAVGCSIYGVLAVLTVGVFTVSGSEYAQDVAAGQGTVIFVFPAMVVAGILAMLLSKRFTDVPRTVMTGFPIALFGGLATLLIVAQLLGW